MMLVSISFALLLTEVHPLWIHLGVFFPGHLACAEYLGSQISHKLHKPQCVGSEVPAGGRHYWCACQLTAVPLSLCWKMNLWAERSKWRPFPLQKPHIYSSASAAEAKQDKQCLVPPVMVGRAQTFSSTLRTTRFLAAPGFGVNMGWSWRWSWGWILVHCSVEIFPSCYLSTQQLLHSYKYFPCYIFFF